MGDVTKTSMGVCNVSFDSNDLGYTKGFVKVEYTVETNPVEVDQEDSIIDEKITKQEMKVTVPLAEYDLERLAGFLPGTTYVPDATDPATKYKMVMTGSSGSGLRDLAKELIIAPVGGGETEKLTLHHAAPIPNISFSYEKDNLKVFEITFKALVGTNGYVTWGDKTAVAA
ncbi:MAG: hypothetical protein GY760_00875 [Deltaproteobacteria bacterium]|nr:hypothetical protein [Deltaproteobacteria bacterium]